MEAGYLNNYFSGVAVKRLSAVEADASTSNQHEYNGVSMLKHIFGTEMRRIATDFLYLEDDEDDLKTSGEITWYDARANNPNRTEWRLYYPSNDVTLRCGVGDSLFICLKNDGTALEIIARKDSVIENQLFWLFNINPDDNPNVFTAHTELVSPSADRVSFVARMILGHIGIDAIADDTDYTDILIERFGNAFPSTRDFSAFARSLVDDADPVNQPDEALLKWYEREEALFMCMERILIQDRLQTGFISGNTIDVDAFIRFSLSVNNRRKSRAGFSFENHLEALFSSQNIRYSHTPITENRSKPDFIFPAIELYRDERYPAAQLTMLGAKTTAKDRWRQVLGEADRIDRKHLITLEGAISENQTNEMISRNLQLVVPKPIHESFSETQQAWLYSVEDFLTEVRERQAFCDSWTH